MATPTPPLDNEFWQWLKGLLTAAVIGLLAIGFRDIKKKFDTVPELEKLVDRLDMRMNSLAEKLMEIEQRLREYDKR